MISIRLPRRLQERLALFSTTQKASKSDIIRRALEDYLESHEREWHPYRLGEDLFGKHGSGVGTLSQDYKKRVKEKIYAKMPH